MNSKKLKCLYKTRKAVLKLIAKHNKKRLKIVQEVVYLKEN